MPIRPSMRALYPVNWSAISAEVRFDAARGRCQRCQRPHMATVPVLPDGRWFDHEHHVWRDTRGRDAPWPDLLEAVRLRHCRVVLAAAHLDGDPRHNRRRNLRAFCQRCHLAHDRQRSAEQRRLTVRQRYAVADLFQDAPALAKLVLKVAQRAVRQDPPDPSVERLTDTPVLPLLATAFITDQERRTA